LIALYFVVFLARRYKKQINTGKKYERKDIVPMHAARQDTLAAGFAIVLY
jgi:hypothetical protein